MPRLTPGRAARELARIDAQLHAGIPLRGVYLERRDRLRRFLIDKQVCLRCGSPLEDPQSVRRGFGPTCWPLVDPRDWLSPEEEADELADRGYFDQDGAA